MFKHYGYQAPFHIEVNSKGDVHISPTKKNVQALQHLVRRARKAKMDEVTGGKNAGTFHGFKSIFELKKVIKAEQEVYVSLLCQHAA
jgi:hypothetical protein